MQLKTLFNVLTYDIATIRMVKETEIVTLFEER